jgi:hypothetical protein
MKDAIFGFVLVAICGAVLFSAPQKGAKKVELPHPFYWAAPDPLRGDWQGKGGYVGGQGYPDHLSSLLDLQ